MSPKEKPSEPNYIKLINGFWAKNSEFDFTGNEAKLYFFLLHISNSLGWKNPFKHSLKQVQAGILISPNSIKSAQKRLMEAGLINVTGGTSGNRFDIANKTEYTILSVSKIDTHIEQPVSEIDTDKAGLTPLPVSVPVSVPVSKFDSINKLNKTDTNKESKRKVFTPPSTEELKAYFSSKIKEKGSRLNPLVEAEKFESFYSSKGWIVGKTKMVDWKMAVSGWLLRGESFLSGSQSAPKQTTLVNDHPTF